MIKLSKLMKLASVVIALSVGTSNAYEGPSGFTSIKVQKGSIIEGGDGFIRKVDGEFKYCLQTNVSTFAFKKCGVYGSPDSYVRNKLSNHNYRYVGLSTATYGDVQEVTLFYKKDAANK